MSIEFTAARPQARDFRADDQGRVHVSLHIDIWQDDERQDDIDIDIHPCLWRGQLRVRREDLQETCDQWPWAAHDVGYYRDALVFEINRTLFDMQAAYARARQDYDMSE